MNLTAKRLHELPAVDRPRERLRKRGSQALSDQELLAVLLGTGGGRGVLQLAGEILSRYGQGLVGVKPEELEAIPGVGNATACRLVAALELARRQLSRELPVIREPADVFPYVQEIICKKQEYFVCLSLSGAGEVLASRVVTVGLLDVTLVHPREVFADAVADRAASVIIAHNHPSGVCEPSAEDLALTRQLIEAGRTLGIPVVDHVIVCPGRIVSLREQGLVEGCAW
ncbi:MAG: DNA repair protein RadC [Candidatus Bipolaricaulota bacterium]